MSKNIRELVKTAYSTVNLTSAPSPSAEEIAEVQARVREAAGVNLEP